MLGVSDFVTMLTTTAASSSTSKELKMKLFNQEYLSKGLELCHYSRCDPYGS